MATPVALVVGDIYYEDAKWQALSQAVTLKEYRKGSREGFIEQCMNGAFESVEAIYRSNDSTTVTGPFTQEIISVLPSTVKWICHSSAGYDNIDVAACTQRGIQVSNTPNCNIFAVADLTIFLMIGALRQITAPNNALRNEVAKRARAFGMKIHYHNRHPLPPTEEEGAISVSFDDLITQSDVISLNLALTHDTEHIIGVKEFEEMKNGVVIVNTARGDLIDEEALFNALESGKVYSVGLDVFNNEPHVGQRFLGNEKIIISPHIGAATVETMAAMERLVLEKIRSALFDRKLLTQVHEQLVMT